MSHEGGNQKGRVPGSKRSIDYFKLYSDLLRASKEEPLIAADYQHAGNDVSSPAICHCEVASVITQNVNIYN